MEVDWHQQQPPFGLVWVDEEGATELTGGYKIQTTLFYSRESVLQTRWCCFGISETVDILKSGWSDRGCRSRLREEGMNDNQSRGSEKNHQFYILLNLRQRARRQWMVWDMGWELWWWLRMNLVDRCGGGWLTAVCVNSRPKTHCESIIFIINFSSIIVRLHTWAEVLYSLYRMVIKVCLSVCLSISLSMDFDGWCGICTKNGAPNHPWNYSMRPIHTWFTCINDDTELPRTNRACWRILLHQNNNTPLRRRRLVRRNVVCNCLKDCLPKLNLFLVMWWLYPTIILHSILQVCACVSHWKG